MKVLQDPDSNILMMELSSQPIDHAREVGGVIVHFSPAMVPVLIEVLDASKFSSKRIKKIKENTEVIPI